MYGFCMMVWYCVVLCVYGICLNDFYICYCNLLYVGIECDIIQCFKCCLLQICDCSNLDKIQCYLIWYYDCCFVKFCFRGDILVYIFQGLVLIENIKEGDMVVIRYEGEDFLVMYLCCVDQV